MKKILTAVLILSAASLAFAADAATNPDKPKGDDKDCCCKDAKVCPAAKDTKAAGSKKDAKDAAPADKK
jgi:hypothetical protein